MVRTFDWRYARKCAALANGVLDGLTLGFFGLAAAKNTSNGWKWRKVSPFVPKLWLRPKRLNGLRLLIDPTDPTHTIIFEEIFFKSSYDLTKLAFAPDIIIDCGAHIGMFSLLAKGAFPDAKVLAYEPNPANAAYVRKVILANRIDVLFHECAVSTQSGDFDFVAEYSCGGALRHEETEAQNAFPSYRVRVIDFCAAIRSMRPERLLLKMDIEGEERHILPNLVPLLPDETALFFETHAGEAGWHEVEQLLRENGFEVENINARDLYYDGFAWRGDRPLATANGTTDAPELQ